MPAAQRLENFIGGKFSLGRSERELPDINPSDATDVIAQMPEGTADDVAAAVNAAAEALPRWMGTAGPARAQALEKWAAAVAARLDELARAMSREVGKPITEARGEVARCVTILRYFAGEAVREMGVVVPAQSAESLQFTLHQPLGVVALITPWNFPLAIPLWKAAPALAFGNTVVLKPSEMSPRMAVLLAESARDAGLPAGVFNVVLGTGAAGEAVIRSEAVRAVSFTGSATTGARVAAIAASRNIRYQTEMGGKNVVIVLPDADLDLAAALTAGGAMRCAGQKCTATSRAVVMRSVEDPFLERLRREIEKLPLGPVEESAAAIGPVISGAAKERIEAMLARAEGEKVCGGPLPDDPRLARGFFLPPTVYRDVPRGNVIAGEELFGPVLAVFAAEGLEEAIAIANRTRYGLSASLFTKDIRSALAYIRSIEAGMVRINGDTTGVDPHAPFGGVKGSSSGSREQGPAARDFYTEIKTVQVNP